MAVASNDLLRYYKVPLSELELLFMSSSDLQISHIPYHTHTCPHTHTHSHTHTHTHTHTHKHTHILQKPPIRGNKSM